MGTLKSILIRIAEFWGASNIPITLKIGLPLLFVVCLIIFIARRATPFIILILVSLLVTFFILSGNFLK